MNIEPLPNGANGGRDAAGRFTKGNAGGPGNPNARNVNRWRAALIGSVTEEDVEAVVEILVAKAKAGEPWAIKEFLDRTLGKAVQPATHEFDDGERHPVRIIFDMGGRDGDGPASKGTQF